MNPASNNALIVDPILPVPVIVLLTAALLPDVKESLLWWLNHLLRRTKRRY